jgi:hypothetical protein
MLQIIYESRATEQFDQGQLLGLVEHAQNRNRKDGVTGLLIYHDRTFLQILEGPEDAVLACYDRIERDPRHSDIWPLAKFELQNRAFSRWTMGLADTSSVPANMEDCTRNLEDIKKRVQEIRETAPGGSGASYTARLVKSFLSELEKETLIESANQYVAG